MFQLLSSLQKQVYQSYSVSRPPFSLSLTTWLLALPLNRVCRMLVVSLKAFRLRWCAEGSLSLMFSTSSEGFSWSKFLSVSAEGEGAVLKGAVLTLPSMVLSMMWPINEKALVTFSWFSFLREKMGCRVWQVFLKLDCTSSQAFSSALNFQGCSRPSTLSTGEIRYPNASAAIISDDTQQESLICESNRISPSGLQSNVKSSNFMEKSESSPAMLELTEDLRRRLYLSTQQQRQSPAAERQAPMGMRETQRKVNHMISMISAQRLPMLYCIFSMILLASFCVRSLRPQLSLRLMRTPICQGLMSQMKGTKRAFMKNITVSSSITPQGCWQKLWKRRSSTASVISAVVKNIPTAYFSAKWNSSWAVVGWRSKSVMRCRILPITNLLKKMTPMRAMQTMVTAALQEPWPSSLKLSSIRIDFSESRKKKTMVMLPRKSVASAHPAIILPTRLCSGQLMCSQLISFGSGASSIPTSHASPSASPNACRTCSSLRSSKPSIIASLSSSVPQEKISFSAMHSSFSSSSSSRSQYCCSSLSLLSSWRPSSSSRCELALEGSALTYCFISWTRSEMWSSIWQNSSYSGRKVIWWGQQGLLKAVVRNLVSLSRMPGRAGMLVTRMEQSEREQVRSSQQLRVLVMRSRMQRRTPNWTTKEKTLTTTSALSTSLDMRERQSMKVQWTSPSWHMASFSEIAQKISSALQQQILTSSRMMQYFTKTQNSGKPKPRNYSSFEFSHSGGASFWITFRQHGHIFTPPVLPSPPAIPGYVEMPCSSAASQSGFNLDASIQSKINLNIEIGLSPPQISLSISICPAQPLRVRPPHNLEARTLTISGLMGARKNVHE